MRLQGKVDPPSPRLRRDRSAIVKATARQVRLRQGYGSKFADIGHGPQGRGYIAQQEKETTVVATGLWPVPIRRAD